MQVDANSCAIEEPVDPSRLLGFVAFVQIQPTRTLFVHEIIAIEKRVGVGSALLKDVVECACDYTSVQLLVARYNHTAIQFYTSLGFAQCRDDEQLAAQPTNDQICLIIDCEMLLKRVKCQTRQTRRNIEFAQFSSRQRLALNEMNLYKHVMKVVKDHHGGSESLPRDTCSEIKATYVCALSGAARGMYGSE